MKDIYEVPPAIRNYARGARAYYGGIGSTFCPLVDEINKEQWVQGWMDAAKRDVQDELAREFKENDLLRRLD